MDNNRFNKIKAKINQAFVPLPEHADLANLKEYAYIGSFKEGLAVAQKYKEDGGKGLFGFINKKGETVIPFEYFHARDFSEGLAAVANFKEEIVAKKIETHESFMDTLLKQILPEMNKTPQKESVLKYGFIDLNGKEIVPLRYEDAYPFSEGIAVVKRLKKWYLLSKKDFNILDGSFENVLSPRWFEDGKLQVVKDGKEGWISKQELS